MTKSVQNEHWGAILEMILRLSDAMSLSRGSVILLLEEAEVL